jgi:predicted nucleic acid-binding protein
MVTLGMLVLANKQGLIPEISEPIQAIQDAGLWISDDLIQFLKQQAEE